jgi:scyllo-inositol 2-dehydrogenase (NADP+)
MSGRQPVRVGVIGLGNSGWWYHAEDVFRRSDRYRLTAVASRTMQRAGAAAAAFGARAHEDWRDLVQSPDVDLVVVATPHDLHRDMTVAALQAGKHVVVEKPMATTRDAALEMLAAAESSGTVLTVHHNRRWEGTFQRLRRLVEDGELGEVWRVEERRMHSGRYTVAGAGSPHTGAELAAWAHTPEGGGGVTNLIAPHLIDHQLQLFGRPPDSVAATMHTFPGDRVDHHLDLRLAFGEATSRIEVFRETRVDLPKWAVHGTAGAAWCPDFATLVVERAGHTREVVTDIPVRRGAPEFYDLLWTAVRHGGPPPVDARDGLASATVLALAARSARTGGDSLPYPRDETLGTPRIEAVNGAGG